jgi:two-component system chemotaxis response regulator CheY
MGMPATTIEAADFSGLHVLLVDDNKFIRILIREILRGFGFLKITEALSVSEALERMQHSRPDIIICDWMMDPDDGMALLRKVRGHADVGFRMTPFIMLSGEVRDERVSMAIGEGADSYVAKPFTAATLMSHLLRVIAKDEEQYFLD